MTIELTKEEAKAIYVAVGTCLLLTPNALEVTYWEQIEEKMIEVGAYEQRREEIARAE